MKNGRPVLELYGPSAIKRQRRTKDQIDDLREVILRVLQEEHPQSVRHVFYRVVSISDLINKDEKGYRTVQRLVLEMRKAGSLPWSWVSDGTRWRIARTTFDSVEDAIRHTAETYRRDLWRRTPVYVEVWCESDSMAGVVVEETDRYGVSLMTSRGFSSASYLYSAAQTIKYRRRPAYLYYIGDWDPSGKLIPEKIEQGIREHARGVEVFFERLLVTPDQISEWNLPTKPAKKTTHAAGFSGGTVEAEAVPASTTRRIVREAIEQHLDLREVEVIETAEESERDLLHSLAESFQDGAAP